MEKGSDLTLEEVLEVVQSEDSTQCQVEAKRQQTQIRTENNVPNFQARQSPWKGGAKQKKKGQPNLALCVVQHLGISAKTAQQRVQNASSVRKLVTMHRGMSLQEGQAVI